MSYRTYPAPDPAWIDRDLLEGGGSIDDDCAEDGMIRRTWCDRQNVILSRETVPASTLLRRALRLEGKFGHAVEVSGNTSWPSGGEPVVGLALSFQGEDRGRVCLTRSEASRLARFLELAAGYGEEC